MLLCVYDGAVLNQLTWTNSAFLVHGQVTIIFVMSVSFFFLFFPRLISAAADWMSAILPHMVWP